MLNQNSRTQGSGIKINVVLKLWNVLWPPHAKSWLIGKDYDAGRGWGQEEKRTKEDEMAVWHHWLDGRESEWTPGVGDGQGGLACCYSWGCKELDTTEPLNWTELNFFGIGMKTDLFQSLLSFPNLLAYWVQHFHSIIFQDLKQLNWDSITSTSFIHSDAF